MTEYDQQYYQDTRSNASGLRGLLITPSATHHRPISIDRPGRQCHVTSNDNGIKQHVYLTEYESFPAQQTERSIDPRECGLRGSINLRPDTCMGEGGQSK